jgi:hypothetical protein
LFGIGWFATSGAVDFSYHVRPDANMAFALLAGFLALQASRAEKWETKRLFLGSFLVTYGCTVHYPALFAWIGVAAFAFFAFRDLPPKSFGQWLLIVAAGGCLAGVPYLVFHLLPNLADLRRYSDYVSMSKLVENIKLNFTAYHDLYAKIASYPFPGLIYAWPIKELLAYSIPPFAVAAALMVPRSDVRPLALSLLPFTCFLFFVSGRKWLPYYDVDCILLLVAVWIWIAAGWMKLASFAPPRLRSLAPAVFGLVVLAVFFTTTPALATVELRAHQHEYLFLRALGKEIAGPDATVSSIHPAWFFSGGRRWFDLTNDLLQNPFTQDPRTYWSRFDAVVVPHTTSMATNTKVNEPTLYIDGILRLRGFLVSRLSPGFRWIYMSPRADKPVEGFLWRNGALYKFAQSDRGEYVIVSLVTDDVDALLKSVAPIQFWYMDLPASKTRRLLFLFTERSRLQSLQHERLIEVVPGSMQPADLAAYPVVPLNDDRITIFPTYSELLSFFAAPAPGTSPVPLDIGMVSNRARGERLSSSLNVTEDATQWDSLASAAIPGVSPGHDYKITFDAAMKEGGLRLQVVSGNGSTVLATVYQEVPVPRLTKSFVFRAVDNGPVYFVVGAWNTSRPGSVSATIENAVVQEVRLTR